MLEQPSLAGPLARIDRADELTLQLTASCNAFLATRPYTVEERPDENPPTRAFLITALRDVPLLPRIIAGEVAHHLRASLDLMVYQIMLKSGVTDAKLLKKSVFPVLKKDLSTAQGRGEYHAAIKKAIGPLPVTLRARIEALQPCNTNHSWSHLAQLQRLDNTQKHRLLLAATSSIRIGGWNLVERAKSETRCAATDQGGSWRRALEALDRCDEAVRKSSWPPTVAMLYLHWAQVQSALRDLPDARTNLARAWREIREHGLTRQAHNLFWFLSKHPMVAADVLRKDDLLRHDLRSLAEGYRLALSDAELLAEMPRWLMEDPLWTDAITSARKVLS